MATPGRKTRPHARASQRCKCCTRLARAAAQSQAAPFGPRKGLRQVEYAVHPPPGCRSVHRRGDARRPSHPPAATPPNSDSLTRSAPEAHHLQAERGYSGTRCSRVKPLGPALFQRSDFAGERINSVAPQRLMHAIAVQQVVDPAEFRMRLFEKLTGLKPQNLKPGVSEQMLHLHRHILAIMPRFGLLALLPRPYIRGEEGRMITLQNS